MLCCLVLSRAFRRYPICRHCSGVRTSTHIGALCSHGTNNSSTQPRLTRSSSAAARNVIPSAIMQFEVATRPRIFPPPPPGWRTRGIVSGLGCELWRWKLGGTCEVRQILFLPLGIFDSYVSLIQNKIFFGTLRRISDLTDLAVTSWAFSCLLNPGIRSGGAREVPP